LRFDPDLALIFGFVMTEKLRYLCFSLMNVHGLLPDKVGLKAKLQIHLALAVLKDPPVPRDLGAYFKLICLSKVHLMVRIGLTGVRKRVLPGEITLRL